MIGADRFRPDSPETPFTEKLRAEAVATGISLPGYRDHAAVMAALGQAGIAVVPSRWQEPFGLTALEAMASGVALITTRRGGLAELTEGVSVAIDPDDPAGMAAAIVALARDPQARAERWRTPVVTGLAPMTCRPPARDWTNLRTELLTP